MRYTLVGDGEQLRYSCGTHIGWSIKLVLLRGFALQNGLYVTLQLSGFLWGRNVLRSGRPLYVAPGLCIFSGGLVSGVQREICT